MLIFNVKILHLAFFLPSSSFIFFFLNSLITIQTSLFNTTSAHYESVSFDSIFFSAFTSRQVIDEQNVALFIIEKSKNDFFSSLIIIMCVFFLSGIRYFIALA